MHVFTPKNVETLLVLLVGDTVADFAAEHHLVATCEIIHHILQLWHISLFVNLIEIDQLICR